MEPIILISDDEPMVCTALTRLAVREGLVPISDTRANVLELARRNKPSVILLDVNQSVNGLDLLFQLRAEPETREIPVVIITAFGDEATRKRALVLGAAAVQTKPFASGFMANVAVLARARDAKMRARASLPQ